MMALPNCWEIRRCGREKGGPREAELGRCPAWPDRGHSCWLVAGTLCGGEVQGTYAQKEANCLKCDVYRLYNLNDGTRKKELIEENKAELALCLNCSLDHLRNLGDERIANTITLALESTLEKQVEERTRELLAANKRLLKEVEMRRRAERKIRRMAFYDRLTGLPNRIWLERRLAREIGRVKRGRLALLFIDLDRLKTINDTLGHFVGDRLLRAVAERLRGLLRGGDVLARRGGDEFVVLLSRVESPEHIGHLTGQIMSAVRRPYKIESYTLHITVSIGIAICPDDGSSPHVLMRSADIAMYQAKGMGRNTFQFFKSEMSRKALAQAHLEVRLAEALEHEEFRLLYQPQYSLKTGELVGVEALVRWDHPRIGTVSPAQFVPLAENTGLIIPLGAWVLRTACRQNKAWQDEGHPPIRMAVNLSARQFREHIVEDLVSDVLRDTGLDARWLDVEITESDIIQNAAKAVSTLRGLREKGVRVSLDDFGTGYSSLNHLRSLPVDTVKIDRSFIEELSSSGDDAAILDAIITMAHRLGLEALAEGVETEVQLDLLRRLHCDEVQGFLVGRPLSSGEMEDLFSQAAERGGIVVAPLLGGTGDLVGGGVR